MTKPTIADENAATVTLSIHEVGYSIDILEEVWSQIQQGEPHKVKEPGLFDGDRDEDQVYWEFNRNFPGSLIVLVDNGDSNWFNEYNGNLTDEWVSIDLGIWGSSRETKRKNCKDCGKAGFVDKPEVFSVCAACNGNGYVVDKETDRESVCALCNGDGEIAATPRESCPACSGQGYVVQIIETTRSKCPQCLGKGLVSLECRHCGGAGLRSSLTCGLCVGQGTQNSWCPKCKGSGVSKKTKTVQTATMRGKSAG